MNARSGELALPSRTIAVPGSISQAAQMALSKLVGEDGLPLHAHHATPSPDDFDGWMRLKASAEAQYESAVKRLAGTFMSTSMTIEISPAKIYVATPKPPFTDTRAIIDLHGGAFVVGGGEACRISAHRQADLHALACFGIDYRMPPEHPYPAPLDDCLAAYRHVLQSYDAQGISICGRSAGGNLAAAMLLRARDEGLPMPASLVLLSPQVDLTESGDSFQTNQMFDLVLPRPLLANNLLYAGGVDLSEPYVSPLFGDLRDFPPTFIQSGTRDLFLSNAVRMHRNLLKAGVQAELHVFEAMPHGGFMGGTPEDQELDREVSRFVARNWL